MANSLSPNPPAVRQRGSKFRRGTARLRTVLPLLLLLTLLLWPKAGQSLASADSRESRYEIVSHGFRVGTLQTNFSLVPFDGHQALKYSSVTHIHASLLFYSLDAETKEEAVVDDDATVSYRRNSRRNGSSTDVTGRAEKDGFHLDVTADGVKRSLVFDRKLYDHTTMECPELLLKHEGDEMTERILDFETLSIVTRHYRWVRTEDVAVGEGKVRCRVIDFEDQNKKGRRWIRQDGLGVIIARQDGTGKDGSYSLRMTKLNTKG